MRTRSSSATKPANFSSAFQRLPIEVLYRIFDHLTPGALWLWVRPVCKVFQNAIEGHHTRFLNKTNIRITLRSTFNHCFDEYGYDEYDDFSDDSIFGSDLSPYWRARERYRSGRGYYELPTNDHELRFVSYDSRQRKFRFSVDLPALQHFNGGRYCQFSHFSPTWHTDLWSFATPAKFSDHKDTKWAKGSIELPQRKTDFTEPYEVDFKWIRGGVHFLAEWKSDFDVCLSLLIPAATLFGWKNRVLQFENREKYRQKQAAAAIAQAEAQAAREEAARRREEARRQDVAPREKRKELTCRRADCANSSSRSCSDHLCGVCCRCPNHKKRRRGSEPANASTSQAADAS